MTEAWWIEVDAHGCILQKTGGEAPRAAFGGTVHEVSTQPDPARQMYVDGSLLDIGERPSWQHRIDPVARAWVVPGKTDLQVAQDARWSEIKNERDRRETAGFSYLGKIIDSDAESALRISGAASAAQAAVAAGLPFSINWTCQENTALALDAPSLIGMLVALAQHADQQHQVSRGLRAAIYAEGATLVSVAAVAWPEDAPSA